MFWKLLLLFIVVPLVELTLLLLLGDYTRWWVPLLLVILTGVVGAALARHQGWRTYRRIRTEMREGILPGDALLDAAMIFAAGGMLLTPGMLTDALGLSLLTPFCRRFYKARLKAWFKAKFELKSETHATGKTEIIDTYVIESDGEERPVE
ncbi:MAG: FxsA family protein [Pirellulaceae bacterium]